MKTSSIHSVLSIMLLCSAMMTMIGTQAAAKSKPVQVQPHRITCNNRRSKCFKKYVTCPVECPQVRPKDPYAKSCFLDCYSPKCETHANNCDGPGATCYDPRFIGGDGIVFYFHGQQNEHFSLVSDSNIQINARFIGLRPAGRTRDYTWIQGLGIMFASHSFTLEATRAEKWDDQVDHLRFSFDGDVITVPEVFSAEWNSAEGDVKLERMSIRNNVVVTIEDLVEISANVVPVTEEESLIHNYRIPDNDSFAHLEVQFRFFCLSAKVDGVLGRTYQPDFQNPAKPGVAMAVVGGDDRYMTSSLTTSDFKSCVFNHLGGKSNAGEENFSMENRQLLDCSGGVGSGRGMNLK